MRDDVLLYAVKNGDQITDETIDCRKRYGLTPRCYMYVVLESAIEPKERYIRTQ